MNRKIQFFGVAGLVILIFGLLTFALVEHDPYHFTGTHLIMAVLLLGAFAVQGGLLAFGKSAFRRAARFGAGATLYSALFVGLLVLVNYFVHRHDPIHYDSTEQNVYTLAPQTKEVLRRLQKPVVVRAFFVGGELEPEVDALLKRILRESTNIRLRVILLYHSCVLFP